MYHGRMDTAEPGILELSPAEGRALVEREAQAVLGLSVDEFRRAWEAGELDPETPGVLDVALLLPFAR